MLKTNVSSEFKFRREKLMKENPESAFLFPSHPVLVRNADVVYDYRQDSNFYYLSAFDESESFLAIYPSGKGKGDFKTALFVQDRIPEKELWDGELYGQDRAKSVFGVDEAFSIGDISKKLPELLKDAKDVYYRLGLNESIDRQLLHILERLRTSTQRTGKGLQSIHDPRSVVGEMRFIKSEEEIGHMRKASEISARAHCELMKAAKPGMKEYELEALFTYEIRKNGCGRLAYYSIVASGSSATVLHYNINNGELKDGDFLLVDAGGEYDYYAADITRAYPVGKDFTTGQRKIYDLVLKVQKDAIAGVKPGAIYKDLIEEATLGLTEGLLSLGLLKGNAQEIITKGEQKRFYPHGLGHWLGMDVHDVGLYQKDGSPRALESGMVLTIEPGLYFQRDDAEVPDEFKHIGVRIEDDILVTDSGCEILTSGVPKEPDEVLALCHS